MAGSESPEVLGKEQIITALSALKHFPEREVFSLLSHHFYSADEDVSIAAIRAAAWAQNLDAIPHFFQLIERAKSPVRVEAIRALAQIRDPLSVEKLLKYFPLYHELEVKAGILSAVNSIIPSHGSVAEFNRSILIDREQDDVLKEIAVRGLTQTGDFATLSYYIPHAKDAIRREAFSQILKKESGSASDFLWRMEEHAHTFTGDTLGIYLCAYLLKCANPKNNLILTLLRQADAANWHAFLKGILEHLSQIPSVKRVFRVMLLIPYLDEEVEKLTDRVLKEVMQLTRRRFPRAVNELISLTVVHLDALFKKVSKNYLSLKGVTGKESLLGVLLARLIERTVPQALVQEVQQHFKDDATDDALPLIEKIRKALEQKPEEEKRRFEACMPLFMEAERIRRLNTYTIVKNMNPENPMLLRRLTRVIRAIGWLGVKQAVKKIWEIHTYSRSEKVLDLEATCVITLCELYAKNIVPEFHQFFTHSTSQMPQSREIQKAYIYGARFLPPMEVADTLLMLLLRTDVEGGLKLRILDTLRMMDLKGLDRVSQALVRVFDTACEPGVLEMAAEVISRSCDATIFHTLLDLTRKQDPGVRIQGVRIVKALAKRDTRVPMEVLTNRLYQLLEDSDRDVRIESLYTLLDLGDDYASKILRDWLDSDDEAVIPPLLFRVKNLISTEELPHILRCIESPHKSVQDRLRELLPGLANGQYSLEVKRLLLQKFGEAPDEIQRDLRVREPAVFSEKESLISHAKAEFRFKHEHSQVLTVFFIDIAGYTDRSIRVDMSSLMSLVKTFEEIVVPCVEGYNGNIVKKMGDGILAIFRQPINAVLSSLEIQDEVRSHNRFTVDEERFFVRIGLHTGPVIRKEGDIYGDVVNIASRMESAANPGEIMITGVVYNEVKDYVMCREIGGITVKGVKEPISAYIPEKVLEETVDVLSSQKDSYGAYVNEGVDSVFEKLKESLFSPRFQLPAGLDQSNGMYPLLQELFEEMVSAVDEISHDYHEEYAFKRYLQEKWNEIMQKLSGKGR